jgi:amidohydrolase
MLPTLKRVAGDSNVITSQLSTPAEDFALYQKEIPGMSFFLGITPRDKDHMTVPRNHSPYFFADEGALPVGVRLMTNVALDYLSGKPTTP